jgi:hypothetical protein
MTAPFWILTNPHKQPAVVAPKNARYVAAFESLNNAMAFVPRRQEAHLRGPANSPPASRPLTRTETDCRPRRRPR